MFIMKTLVILFSLSALTGCMLGPDYHKPDVTPPAAYKEARDWKLAEPKDDAPRGHWWEIYGDADLNALVGQVAITNQNVLAAAASYRQAQALLDVAQASYFPTVSAGLTASRAHGTSPGNSSVIQQGAPISNVVRPTLSASWEPDLWGQVGRNVEASTASAQASRADLGNVLLSAQATLVQSYFQLRVDDAEQELLGQTVASYERSLQITQNLKDAGVDSSIDVAQAETLLNTARAQLIDLRVQRAQLEHAIAVLTGKAPADFQIKPTNTLPALPPVPSTLPSVLLERRPDIAAAERVMAQENAQVGVAQAAFFPSMILNATRGYQNSSVSQLFTAPNSFWSLGPTFALTLFNGGALSAQKRAALAVFDNSVATYRQTVLAAFQSVEDNLAALHHLEEEAAAQQAAERASAIALERTENQYQAGTVSYLNVVTAHATLLNEKISNLTTTGRRLIASATLIPALGGDWQPEAK
jgi:NodT family efflux transporter outer membrane factor (OMF) lipoprotein